MYVSYYHRSVHNNDKVPNRCIIITSLPNHFMYGIQFLVLIAHIYFEEENSLFGLENSIM